MIRAAAAVCRRRENYVPDVRFTGQKAIVMSPLVWPGDGAIRPTL